MTSTVLEREAVIPARVRWDLRRGLRQLALAGAVPLVALAAAWYGHHWWTVGRFIESTDDAYVGGDITVIAPKVAGFIGEVAVADNQAVHAGDLLVRLDDRDYRAALEGEAAVAAQQAALANLDATRRLQEAVVAEAKAEIAATAAEIARIRVRPRPLPQARVQRVRVDAAPAAGRRRSPAGAGGGRQGARGAGGGRAPARGHRHRRSRRPRRRSRRRVAGREIAELNLGYTEIRAPIDGTVGNRSARAGAYATVGAQLMSLVPARGLWVDANFKESQLARMRPGQPVTIEADVLPGEAFSGHVASLAPATGAEFSVLPAENATGNFTKIVQRVPVRILLDGDAATLGRLRPGPFGHRERRSARRRGDGR